VTEEADSDLDPALLHILSPDEELHVQARAIEGTLAVTDRRVVVTKEGRVTMDVPYAELRRVQFDIERERPATLVIVPESPSQPPDVLAIEVDQYENVARALTLVGRGLAAAG
jgi:hypothetical protein